MDVEDYLRSETSGEEASIWILVLRDPVFGLQSCLKTPISLQDLGNGTGPTSTGRQECDLLEIWY
jgi:hypothetical protein